MLSPYFNKALIEAGCDEAGRGCLSGPVFAAAVILPRNITPQFPSKKGRRGRKKLPEKINSEWAFLEKVNDSKKLTDEVRKELRPMIEKMAVTFAVGIVSVEEIDEINILNASFLAMHRAIDQLKMKPQSLLIDGNRFNKYKSIPHQCIIKGDEKILSIAAASILAKTYRDDHMDRLHEKFPGYGWNRNKGYATRSHRLAIRQYGAVEHHRQSFTLLS